MSYLHDNCKNLCETHVTHTDLTLVFNPFKVKKVITEIHLLRKGSTLVDSIFKANFKVAQYGVS